MVRRLNIAKTLLVLIFFLCIFLAKACGENYTNKEIAEAIWHAEGGELASKPYGILYVKCDTKDECKVICLNTIRNNQERYADYGHKQYDTFLEFLASRYAPLNALNDPSGLNSNWLKNVLFFLRRLNNEI